MESSCKLHKIYVSLGDMVAPTEGYTHQRLLILNIFIPLDFVGGGGFTKLLAFRGHGSKCSPLASEWLPASNIVTMTHDDPRR